MGASVKIMLSYDYCHFEVCKSTDENISDEQINEMRKDVQRLADEAVRQYKIAKKHAAKIQGIKNEEESHLLRMKRVYSIPEDQRSPEQKAYLKQAEDTEFSNQFKYREYNYEDDFDPEEEF
jgi:hypothetical protein